MRTPLDFGNGIIAYFEGAASLRTIAAGAVEAGHSGFTSPEFEVVVTENGVADGGSIGTSRTLSRRLRCTVSHDRVWTRKQLQQAFTPGVERTLTCGELSMPYHVEALTFPESLFESARRFTVNLVSPLAFPVGPSLIGMSEVDATTGLEYALEYPIAYDELLSVEVMTLLSQSDVRCPALVTLICSASTSEVSVSINGRRSRIVGSLVAGDVVVFDNTGTTPAVTVNGVNRLSWFDRASEFPALDPGSNLVVLSTPAVISVAWIPLAVGLL